MLCKFKDYKFPAPTVCDPRSHLCLISKKSLVRLVSVALILFFVAVAWTEDGKNPSEPPSFSVPYYLDTSANLIPLESQVVRVRHKYHALGFAGTTTVYLVEGEKSPVRLKTEAKPEFVVRLKENVDPLEFVQLFHFEGIGGSRVMSIGDFDAFGRLSKITLLKSSVDFNASKYGVSSFKLIPVQRLAPGEYCMTVRLATKAENKSSGFCFGIDKVGS